MTAVIRDNPLGFAADNWHVITLGLVLAAALFVVDLVRRRRPRIKPHHRHAMHRLRVRYGRPGLGRRLR